MRTEGRENFHLCTAMKLRAELGRSERKLAFEVQKMEKVAEQPPKIPGKLIYPHSSNDSEQAEI